MKFATDITNQKHRAIDATGQLEAINRSQAVIEFKLDGTIIAANANFCGAVGSALDEIKGQHHRMFVEVAYASSQEYARFWESLRRAEFQTAEYKRVAKGGRAIWIQASYNPIKDAGGVPVKRQIRHRHHRDGRASPAQRTPVRRNRARSLGHCRQHYRRLPSGKRRRWRRNASL